MDSISHYERVNEFVFNVTPTIKVIWRCDHGLEYHLADWKIELRTPSHDDGTTIQLVVQIKYIMVVFCKYKTHYTLKKRNESIWWSTDVSLCVINILKKCHIFDFICS